VTMTGSEQICTLYEHIFFINDICVLEPYQLESCRTDLFAILLTEATTCQIQYFSVACVISSTIFQPSQVTTVHIFV